MLNLSKNGIELLRTHSVVGIEHVWILSQILIQSVKLTKILMCLIYRVYPILSIVFFPSMIKKQCSCCLTPIHNDNGKYIYIETHQNATYNFAEFTRSVKPLKCFSIYALVLSIGKTNSSATHHYLLMVPLSNYGNSKTNSSATSFNMKIRSTQKNHAIKRGSRAKK